MLKMCAQKGEGNHHQKRSTLHSGRKRQPERGGDSHRRGECESARLFKGKLGGWVVGWLGGGWLGGLVAGWLSVQHADSEVLI